jgi:hypothetical protein
MKLGNDPLTADELTKDLWLRENGGTMASSGKTVPAFNDKNHFVTDPVTGEHASEASFHTLDKLGIPYHVWGAELWAH